MTINFPYALHRLND